MSTICSEDHPCSLAVMAELAPQEGHGGQFFEVIEAWRDVLHAGNHREQKPGAWQVPHFTLFSVEILDNDLAKNALDNVQEIQREFQLLLGGDRIPSELRSKGYSRLQAEANQGGNSLDDLFPEESELTLRAGDFIMSENFPFWFMREFIPVGSSHQSPQMRKIERFVNRVYTIIEGPEIVSKFKKGKVRWAEDRLNANKVVLVDTDSGSKLLRRAKHAEFKWHISAGNAINLLNGSPARQKSMIEGKAAMHGAKGLNLRTSSKFGPPAPETSAYLRSVQREMIETRDENRKLPFTDWLIAPRFLSQNGVTVNLRPSNGSSPIKRQGQKVSLPQSPAKTLGLEAPSVEPPQRGGCVVA